MSHRDLRSAPPDKKCRRGRGRDGMVKEQDYS